MRHLYVFCQCTASFTNKYVVFECPSLCLKWRNQDVFTTFCTKISSVFWCNYVVILMSSTSGTQITYVLNDALPAGGCLSMGFMENTRMNEARAAADAAAPVVPNVLNDVLPAGSGLSMGVVTNAKINETRYAADFSSPVAPNVLNYALPVGGSLSMGVVENNQKNEARDDTGSAAPAAVSATNAPVEAI